MEKLFSYFKGFIKETIFGPLFKLLEAIFELLVPLVIAQIIDRAIPNNDQHQLLVLLGLLFVFAFVGVVVAVTAQYFSSKAAVGYTEKLSTELFGKIMSLPKEQRDRIGTASLVSRMTTDTLQVQSGINLFLRLFLRSPFIVFGAIIMAYRISPKLTMLFVIMVAILFTLVGVMSRLLMPRYREMRRQLDGLISLTREQLQGMRVIRAFNQTALEKGAFSKQNYHYQMLQISTSKLSSLVSPLTYLVVNTTLIVLIWQGYLDMTKGGITQGMLVALVNYLLQILTELIKLTMLMTTLNQSFISARRISDLFALRGEELSLPLAKEEAMLAVKAQHVTFTYPGASEPALDDIVFSLRPGDYLGIIGGTGSGKTSLVHLMTNLYQPQLGKLSIFYKGQSPSNLKEWRSWISIVPQKSELFSGTIRSNLTLGLTQEVTDADIWWALDIARASEFVRQKEGQLDAEVLGFGRNFSGGQRQRLTIARAILRKAPFLILDDATSALDYLTERHILSNLKKALPDTTLIMVTQRTGSLSSADKILVLESGKQVAFNTHENLLKESELYQSIHYYQNMEDKRHD